jgi:HK97 family phage prohead protease
MGRVTPAHLLNLLETIMREEKDLRFEVKAVEDSGAFTGLAAVYGNVDLGGDVIEPGAFTKTLSERGSKIHVLWQHDQKQPIGDATLIDTPSGLSVKGQLWMELPEAQRAHVFMKRSRENGLPAGMSIGYDTVRHTYKDNNRHLQELKLWEISVVTTAMNQSALVTAVKAANDDDDWRELSNAIRTLGNSLLDKPRTYRGSSWF